jgi:hypothetical protein
MSMPVCCRIHAMALGVYGGIKEPLPPPLRGFAIMRVLFDIGDHTRVENTRTIVRGIEAGLKIQIGASEV